MRVLEICAGAGGQALGLERAGFEHAVVVDNDAHACATLRLNRPQWRVVEQDVSGFDARGWMGVDLIAGGVPCPPFSVAGKQLGGDDERDLFPQALRIVQETRPRAVLLENVKGLLDAKFAGYRQTIQQRLTQLGYWSEWRLLNAADFGVCQSRPRAILVALQHDAAAHFQWPQAQRDQQLSVGNLLADLMANSGWQGAAAWSIAANDIAPTLVGGSKKHGGPDLGPTRAREAWAKLGVDGRGVANEAPTASQQGMPRLTTRMCARVQGFPDDWAFVGKKTAVYRQIGNAFPPPVAHALGERIAQALRGAAAAERQARAA